ncbi:hypothetical protein [Streptomyces sp. SLBN-134]|uniref:hypothetical protein n=1 Tax=Streptomyces sp. SLBN-134 TaxID=2768456 RepID=UPI00114DB5FB|nr:hypothetical protein [Streptomyces sp. SLBN-134]TQL21940.1 hypothetical protein FBY37_3956 [Streptomyces sp. SLBN-134]
MTTKPRWKSRIRWNDQDQTTHDGRTYELWAHGFLADDRGNHSRHDEYFVHQVLANGNTHPAPLSHALGSNKRKALRLAELFVLGWRNAPGTRSPEHGYREMWRDPDGQLHPIADVLTGAIPH